MAILLCYALAHRFIEKDGSGRAEALSDEILPFIGMLTMKSHFSRTSLVMPSPSLPMTMGRGALEVRGVEVARALSRRAEDPDALFLQLLQSAGMFGTRATGT